MAAAPLIILLATLAAFLACKGLDQRETRYALGSFAFHIVGAFTQWALSEFYFGAVDAFRYMNDGEQIARLLDYDFFQNAPEVAKAALHLESRLPFFAPEQGSSGTMSVIAGVFVFFVGPNLLNLCLLSAPISWFGQLCFYRVAREEVGADDRRPALLGLLFVPSVAYWGGGYAKEALVMGAFGLLALSSYRVLRNRNPVYLAGIAAGGLGVALIKPYVLFAYIFAVAAWIYVAGAWSARGRFRLRPAYLVFAGALAVGGLAEMGRLFPDFAADKVAESMAKQQEVWQEVEAVQASGSSVEMGSGEARSISQQLRYVPLAFVNSLFRPAIFEAKNAAQLGAAIETTLFALAVVSLFGKHARRVTGEAIKSSPLLVFCIVFVGSFAICVGLATSNLGSLSRYRVPMMPFYATVVLILLQKARAEKTSAAESQRLALLSIRRSRST